MTKTNTQSLKTDIANRVARGELTIDQAHEAVDRLDGKAPVKPACFEPYRGLKHEVIDELEAIQRRAVLHAGMVC